MGRSTCAVVTSFPRFTSTTPGFDVSTDSGLKLSIPEHITVSNKITTSKSTTRLPTRCTSTSTWATARSREQGGKAQKRRTALTFEEIVVAHGHHLVRRRWGALASAQGALQRPADVDLVPPRWRDPACVAAVRGHPAAVRACNIEKISRQPRACPSRSNSKAWKW